jgi:hypothetical protein
VFKRWQGARLDLWSLQPVERTAITVKASDGWSRNVIDRFVLERLEAVGLTPSPVADKETLIRRATYDLLGIPPTFEEVQSFVENEAPDAYEQCIDQLMARPDFGIRSAQHWMDVARYSDSNGFERDEYIPSRWRYRDYLIRCFNEDLPYDQFVREQIAGDELAQRNPESPRRSDYRIATIFLRLGQWDSFKAFFDSEQIAREDFLVDVTNTTASAFLGQTFACCRCHDHKTEPLLQADHFRLRAAFAGLDFDDETIINDFQSEEKIREHNHRLELEQREYQQQQAVLLKGARGKQRTVVQESFPADIQQYLELPSSQRTEIVNARLEPFLYKLENIDDDDCLAHLDANELAKYEQLATEIEFREKQKLPYTTISAVRECNQANRKTHILDGGDLTKPKEEVRPGPPTIFGEHHFDDPFREVETGRGTRSQLAEWITSHRNPWTARVMVNRIWKTHFGRGLVETPDDFGFSGAKPSHPELLDWLATEFMQNDWSIKHIHRLIMHSSAYRQSSAITNSAAQQIDPDNRWIWRQQLRRRDAESIRDAILITTGLIKSEQVQEPRWPPIPQEVIMSQPGAIQETSRLQGYYTSPGTSSDVRSVFLVRKRSLLLPFMTAFQLPDASCTCGKRDQEDGPSQAFALLNNDLTQRASKALAERWIAKDAMSWEQRVRGMVCELLSREPTPDELDAMLQTLESAEETETIPRSQRLGHLAQICRALINSNSFLFID